MWQAIISFGFRDLQNYTTLKHARVRALCRQRFRDLQNYTTLKQDNRKH